MALTKRLTKGSPLTAVEMDDNLTYLEGIISAGTNGTSGTSGIAGTSGINGTNGTAGSGGSSGTSGTSGVKGDLFTSTSNSNNDISLGSKTFTIGTGLSWTPGQQTIISQNGSNYMTATVTSYNSGTGQFVVNVVSVVGSGTGITSWYVNTAGATGQAGTSGTSGSSGTSGTSGSSGTSGTSGTSGSSGTSGISGSSGTSGTSGTSGINGSSGTSGISGSSGTSGTSGTSGANGTFFGSSGTSGISGSSGTSGVNGISGSSGTSGTSGISGSSGTSGTSGTSGARGDSLFTQTGSFFATRNNIQITGSLVISSTLTASIAEGYAWVGGAGSISKLVATSSFGGGTANTDGIFVATGSIRATTNNLQITGSLDINGGLTASLRQGYVWVGNSSGKSISQIATSSFGSSLTLEDSLPTIMNNVTKIVFSGASVTNNGNGQATVAITGGGGGAAGTSGTSGTSGAGSSGSSGTSGTNGSSGISSAAGSSGTSGVNGTGQNGTSGTSGADGIGTNGTSGTSGSSGINGIGSSGTSGTSGSNGTNGISGAGASAGTSGTSGVNGTSGLTGGGGTSGVSGSNGTSGTSGALLLTGATDNGVITYNGITTEGVIESSITFDGTTRTLTVSGSADLYSLVKIRRTIFNGNNPPAYVTPDTGMLIVSASGAGGALLFYNGGSWVQIVAGL